MKSIDSLVSDIYDLFKDEPHECNPNNLEALGRSISDVVGRRLREVRSEQRGYLRFSNLDKPDRQLWYEINSEGNKDNIQPSASIKFLFGDILEQLLLFLSKEASHEVTEEQSQVRVDGIQGSIDSVIDGVVVDVKSAASRSFDTFSDKLDPSSKFSYAYQISGYMAAKDKPGALLVIDKQMGHIALHKVVQPVDVKARIQHLKEVIARPEPPERCYDPIPEGKSGNMKLPVVCSYCNHKWTCHPGLREFIYSNGPVYLTTVAKEPQVFERISNG